MDKSTTDQACIMLSIPPPRGGWNKIKWFGDGEENLKLEKKIKENFEDLTLLAVPKGKV